MDDHSSNCQFGGVIWRKVGQNSRKANPPGCLHDTKNVRNRSYVSTCSKGLRPWSWLCYANSIALAVARRGSRSTDRFVCRMNTILPAASILFVPFVFCGDAKATARSETLLRRLGTFGFVQERVFFTTSLGSHDGSFRFRSAWSFLFDTDTNRTMNRDGSEIQPDVVSRKDPIETRRHGAARAFTRAYHRKDAERGGARRCRKGSRGSFRVPGGTFHRSASDKGNVSCSNSRAGGVADCRNTFGATNPAQNEFFKRIAL